jgi:hypothetical protein
MPKRLLILVATIVPSSGCFGRTNVGSTTQHISLPPLMAGGGYTGYTGTSFSPSIDATKQVHLVGVTVSASSGDFSWASSMTGSAEPGQTRVLVSKSDFGEAEGTTALDVIDKSDLRSLFTDGSSFRVYWSILYAQTLAQQYPDGITITVTYTVEVD